MLHQGLSCKLALQQDTIKASDFLWSSLEIAPLSELDQQDDLIAAAVAGDSNAMKRLLFANYSQLEKHISTKIPTSAQRQFDAEDVLQEVFTQAFRDISSYESRADASFLSWLKKIAENKLTDTLRKVHAKKRGGEHRQLTDEDMGLQSTVAQLIELVGQETGTASVSVARHEAAAALQVGVASLPEDQRIVVRAKFFEGKNVQEIADQIDRTPDAVRGLIHRAQKNLAAMMGRSSKWLSR